MKISKGLKQAYDLQDFTYAAALALRNSLRKKGNGRKLVISREDASAIGSLVKAWESCQERIRIHRNKPMPGVLRPEKPKPRKRLISSAPVQVVCPAPGPPSEPEAAVKADAPAEETARRRCRDHMRLLSTVNSHRERAGSLLASGRRFATVRRKFPKNHLAQNGLQTSQGPAHSAPTLHPAPTVRQKTRFLCARRRHCLPTSLSKTTTAYSVGGKTLPPPRPRSPAPASAPTPSAPRTVGGQKTPCASPVAGVLSYTAGESLGGSTGCGVRATRCQVPAGPEAGRLGPAAPRSTLPQQALGGLLSLGRREPGSGRLSRTRSCSARPFLGRAQPIQELPVNRGFVRLLGDSLVHQIESVRARGRVSRLHRRLALHAGRLAEIAGRFLPLSFRWHAAAAAQREL